MRELNTELGRGERGVRRVTAPALFNEHQQVIHERTDRMFAVLMVIQWLAGIAAAYWISPTAWVGATSRTHLHVWAALFLGGAISLFPVILALTRPGRFSTRYTIAVGQMLMGALLIHLTGGRIETHFHVFGSLAFLSFYRDWRVLLPATVVVAADHFLRGVIWPQSVYGVVTASEWRWLEHAGWVLFEDTFLFIAIKRSVSEMWNIAERTAEIKCLNEGLESHVAERTAQLMSANQELKREADERQRADEALLESEERYRDLFENAPIGIYRTTPDGEILMANPTLIHMLGYASFAELAAKNIEQEEPNATYPRRHFKERLEREGEIKGLESGWKKSDGSLVFLRENAQVIRGEDGRVLYYEGTIEDINERKQAEDALRTSEEQLRQAQKMEAVGKLAGGVAHDFNNLLTVINGHTELSLRRLNQDDPMHRKLEAIKEAGERAASLTRQLLAFSRKQILQPKVLDLNQVIFEMNKMLRRLIGEDVDLLIGLMPDLGKVKADPGQIEQMLMNLSVNARDAMPKGGKLTIETANVYLDEAYSSQHVAAPPGNYVMLAVSDNGCGMDDQTQKHIFEPFFTTKEVGKGTGLGLSTVYGIVKQSGGHLWVYSEMERGTTFKIYLPCVDSPLEETKVSTKRTELLVGTETVLLVEDEPMVRAMAREILQENGYQVLEAQHGHEALVVAGQHRGPIHLILSDVVMPQMSGRELAEQLASLRAEMKVLYMSGYTDDAIVHHGVLDEGMAFIEKPFTPEVLTRKIREVLDAPVAV